MMIYAVVQGAVMLITAVLCAGLREKYSLVWAGYCIARGIAGLSGRCSWIYAVVFGELIGLLMLAITLGASFSLFHMLTTERKSKLCSVIYILLSALSCEPTDLCSAAVCGLDCGLCTDRIKSAVVLSAVSGAVTFIALGSVNDLPSAFSVIAYSALVYSGLCELKWENNPVEQLCVGALIALIINFLL